MTVTELKAYIVKEEKLPFILKSIGCGHIKYHQTKQYFSCSNFDGDNPTAITVENYEMLDIDKYFITPGYPKSINLFGLWENYDSIQKAGYVVIYESEKSVLKRDSLRDSTGVALSGHTMSDEQVKILIALNVDVVIALDNDVPIDEIKYMCSKFKGIRNVYYIKDKYDLLGAKDSPADAKNKIFAYLMKNKIKF